MPLPALIGAAIGAAATGGQIYATGKMNKKTREWNEKMYGIQRADALNDWNAQNLYNSPEQQMQRLKAAGLNPNLVYDNGATHTAQSVNSTDVKSWSPDTPDIAGGVNQGLQAYHDITLQQEQVKNLVAQRRNMELDSTLKSLEAAGKATSNSHSALDLAKALELKDTSIQMVKEQLNALMTSTDIKVSQEARDAAMGAPTLAAAIERVAGLKASTALSKQQLVNLKNSAVLQQTEIALRKLGISWSDNVILRVLGQLAGGRSLPEVVKDLWKLAQSAGDTFKDKVDVH